jgi:hypothetical protein
MSKKRKLILAAAVFSAALFAASCGGGGGSTAGTGGGNGSSGGSGGGGGGGGETPPASPEGKVLAMLNVGAASAGPVNPVAVCELMSNNQVKCGNDLNPSENVDLNYLHEFDNGNVVLTGTGDVLYFFNAQNNTLTKLTTFTALDGSSGTVATGITIPANANNYILGSDFVIISNATNDIVVVTKEGRVIRDSNTTVPEPACPIVNKAGFNYRLSTNGTITPVTNVPTLRAQAGGMFLVQEGNSIYLTSDRCTTSGAVLIDTIIGFNNAKMRQVGSEFRIAVWRGATDLHYYRVSGTTVTRLRGPAPSFSGGAITLHGPGTNQYFYDIDGNGYLYAITGAAQVTAYDANGSQINSVAIPGTGAAATGLLAFADRVLVKDTTNNAVHSIDETATRVAVGIDFNAVNRCTQGNTVATNGVGTNFIRCVFDGAAGELLYSLTFDGANYGSASFEINNAATGITQNDVRFGVGRVLVTNLATNNIRLCTTTNTNPPNISCSNTDLPEVNPADLISPVNIRGYLKSNGNNVFYAVNRIGAAVNPPKVGDIFGPPSALPMPVNNPSGGNASFDLTKFAFSFQPPTAPPLCNTHIAYLSSPTATPKLYALPSGTCVARILKVFP